MKVLEDRIPFRAGQLVDGGDRSLGIASAVSGPAGQKRSDEVRDRTADRLIDVGLGACVFLLLEIAHADHKPRHAIGLVDGKNAVGEFDGLINIAVRERGNERPIQKFIVFRIGAKRRPIEGRGRSGVPLDAGMTGGKVTAGRRQHLQVVSGGELRGVVGGMLGRLRDSGNRQCQQSDGGNRRAIELEKHHGSPWLQDLRQGSCVINLECKPSVPVLTFVSYRGGFVYECQNYRGTSKYKF